MAVRNKAGVVTFKADGELIQKLRHIENRSEFIRRAVQSALENACPLCHGNGTLNHHQKRHWHELENDHVLEKCGQCHEYHLVCLNKKK